MMKSIAIDFENQVVCIMRHGQQGTEYNPNLKKVAFSSFIPKQLMDNESFTWDFENGTIAANQRYVRSTGAIMTKEDFVPKLIFPMPQLCDRYDEFIAIMGYEELDCGDLFDEVLGMLGLEWTDENK